MNSGEERYAVIWRPSKRVLARWLRPIEAAAYIETFNRLVQDPLRRAQMTPEPIATPEVENRPARGARKSGSA
jgi:hypothetical protein